MKDTLGDFLGLDDPAQQRASEKRIALSRELDNGALPKALRSPAAKAIIWTAKALLNDPLSGVIGGAWGKVRDLQRFINAPRDQVNRFTLHEHEIALARNPAMDLVVNGVSTGVRLQFELKLGIAISSAVLRIQNARIVGAEFGTARGGGSFSVGRATIAERKTGRLQLPTHLTFSPGIPLH